MSKITKCDCPEEHIIGVEYAYNSKEYYDGVSEWMCQMCWQRVGRWSGKILKAGEVEKCFAQPVDN